MCRVMRVLHMVKIIAKNEMIFMKCFLEKFS